MRCGAVQVDVCVRLLGDKSRVQVSKIVLRYQRLVQFRYRTNVDTRSPEC